MWMDKFKNAIENDCETFWFVCKNQTVDNELKTIRQAKNLFYSWGIGKDRKSNLYQKDIVKSMTFQKKDTMLNSNGKYTNNKDVKEKSSVQYIEYLNIPIGGDTEVNPPQYNPIEKHWVSIPYLWQIFIIDRVVCGFYLEDLEKFLSLFSAYHNLSYNKRMVIYFHNLAYDMSFFKKYFLWEDCFNLAILKPCRWLTKNGIEFRDSACLTGLSLEESAEEKCTYDVEKLTDIMDYTKFHYVGEEIDDKTLKYSFADVKVLAALIQDYINLYGDIAHIPFTLTGEIRLLMKKNCLANEFEGDEWNGFDFRKIMGDSTISSEEFTLAREAFQGGIVRCNKFYLGQTINDKITHIDLSSAYVSMLCSKTFPLGKGEKIEIKSVDEMIDWVNTNKFAFLIEFGAINVRLKPRNSQITTLPYSKCWLKGDKNFKDAEIEKELSIAGIQCNATHNVVQDNGSIVFADYIGITMTEIDFLNFIEMYDFDGIEFLRVYKYELHYLPRAIVLTCLELYKMKSRLKHMKGRQYKILYNKYKSMLNSIYGMFVYNFSKSTSEYDAINDIWFKQPQDLEKCIEQENNRKTRTTSYLVGVWCTAYVRNEIIQGALECGFKDFIYTDTDCLILLNYYKHKKYFDECNEFIKEDLKFVCKKYDIDYEEYCEPTNAKGIKCPLGAWDVEDKYILFKSQGAKRYMTVNKQGEYKITIAGCSKYYRENGKQVSIAEYWHKKNGTIWKAFEEFEIYSKGNGFYIDEEHSGKLTHSYFDKELKGCIFVNDRMVEYNVKSGCVLKPTSFKLGSEEWLPQLIMCLAGVQDTVDFDNSNYFTPYNPTSPIAKLFD